MTIEITEEAYELLRDRAANAGADSLSDLIIAMDESAKWWSSKYMELKRNELWDEVKNGTGTKAIQHY